MKNIVLTRGEVTGLPPHSGKTADREYLGMPIHTDSSFIYQKSFMKKSNKDYWCKLKCVLKYLMVTNKINLTSSVRYMYLVKWWVNDIYRLHADCLVHMGATIFLGKEVVSSFSTK